MRKIYLNRFGRNLPRLWRGAPIQNKMNFSHLFRNGEQKGRAAAVKKRALIAESSPYRAGSKSLATDNRSLMLSNSKGFVNIEYGGGRGNRTLALADRAVIGRSPVTYGSPSNHNIIIHNIYYEIYS